jgi:hypothetical protein
MIIIEEISNMKEKTKVLKQNNVKLISNTDIKQLEKIDIKELITLLKDLTTRAMLSFFENNKITVSFSGLQISLKLSIEKIITLNKKQIRNLALNGEFS